MIIVQAALSGILVGGLYALMAIGLSMTWGMLKVINLAHFGLILLSAYLTYAITIELGLDPSSQYELDLTGVKASFGLEGDVEGITYRDL